MRGPPQVATRPPTSRMPVDRSRGARAAGLRAAPGSARPDSRAVRRGFTGTAVASRRPTRTTVVTLASSSPLASPRPARPSSSRRTVLGRSHGGGWAKRDCGNAWAPSRSSFSASRGSRTGGSSSMPRDRSPSRSSYRSSEMPSATRPSARSSSPRHATRATLRTASRGLGVTPPRLHRPTCSVPEGSRSRGPARRPRSPSPEPRGAPGAARNGRRGAGAPRRTRPRRRRRCVRASYGRRTSLEPTRSETPPPSSREVRKPSMVTSPYAGTM